MIKPLQVIVKILQGKIILDDSTDVRIVKREYPIDKTPCVTMDNSGSTIIQKNITNKEYIIPESHPQYDPQQNEPIDETEITTSYTVVQGQNKVRSLAVDITREVTNFSDSAFTVIVTTNGTTTVLNGSQGAFLLGTEGTKVVLQNFNPEIPMENTEVEIQIASGGITYGNNLSNTNPINVTFSSFQQ